MMKKVNIFVLIIITLFINSYVYASPDNTCCVYKANDDQKVYFYSLSVSGADTKQTAVCYGTDCITNDFSKNNAQLISIQQPWWHDYIYNLSNCYNMPSSIWYANDNGKITFYSGKPTDKDAFEATLTTSESCSSSLSYDPRKPDVNWGDKVNKDCEGILGDDLLDLINKVFRWIQIIAPIFVIIMGSIDFAGAILQDDKDALKKASSKFIKRLIVAVALFFIPIILSFLLNIFNDLTGAASSTCGIGE